MHIVRVPAVDLLYIDPFKKDNKIVIKARYSDRTETITKDIQDERICHWTSFRVGKTMYVQFFDTSEVFGMTDFEKRECRAKYVS